ncbi:MAG: transposase [Hyphomicrobiales bacterium]|nr:transposase [Hyphomicrobiales bacterium]MBV9431307.1 transposase [Hyphomicrobiales bacterium]
MKRRRELAEPAFGTLKWMLGYPRFLLRGLKKPTLSWPFWCLAST